MLHRFPFPNRIIRAVGRLIFCFLAVGCRYLLLFFRICFHEFNYLGSTIISIFNRLVRGVYFLKFGRSMRAGLFFLKNLPDQARNHVFYLLISHAVDGPSKCATGLPSCRHPRFPAYSGHHLCILSLYFSLFDALTIILLIFSKLGQQGVFSPRLE
jgi:hypothetical protein